MFGADMGFKVPKLPLKFSFYFKKGAKHLWFGVQQLIVKVT